MDNCDSCAMAGFSAAAHFWLTWWPWIVAGAATGALCNVLHRVTKKWRADLEAMVAKQNEDFERLLRRRKDEWAARVQKDAPKATNKAPDPNTLYPPGCNPPPYDA